MQSREAGLRGEQAAAEWLIANGFELLHRNWRSGRYELDIVALREGVLHVVEVKCRRSGALSPPEEAMTPRKFAALMRATEHYVALYGFDTDTQFDLVTVEYRPDGECDLHYFPNASQDNVNHDLTRDIRLKVNTLCFGYISIDLKDGGEALFCFRRTH